MVIYKDLGDGTVKAYSDKNVYIHGGFPEADYAEAVDPVEAHRTYTETDIPIEVPEKSEELSAEQVPVVPRLG